MPTPPIISSLSSPVLYLELRRSAPRGRGARRNSAVLEEKNSSSCSTAPARFLPSRYWLTAIFLRFPEPRAMATRSAPPIWHSSQPRSIVIAEIKAGDALDATFTLESGQAAAIMTGAPAPPGSDAVVMVEYTSRDARSGHDHERNCSRGQHRSYRGRGKTRRPAAVSGHASGSRRDCRRRIGGKIAPAGLFETARRRASHRRRAGRHRRTPGLHQIRNSNTYSLAAQIQAAGGEAVLLPIAPDEPERLRELIAEASRPTCSC